MWKSALLCCLQYLQSNFKSCRAIWMIKNTTSAPSDTPSFHVAPAFLERNAHILQVSDWGKKHMNLTHRRSVHVLLVNTASLKMQKGLPGSHSAPTAAKFLNTSTAERAAASLTFLFWRQMLVWNSQTCCRQFILLALVNKRKGRLLDTKPLSRDAGLKLRTRLCWGYFTLSVCTSWVPQITCLMLQQEVSLEPTLML